MKRMLFNATHPEELRVAIVEGQKLADLDIESATYQQKKGNIYKGRVTRVEPSLEAAFVDYGSERQGFLPLKEISRIYFQGDPRAPLSQARIKDVIKEGQELVIQIEKEERGNKGAALTTFISLAGRYLVLMPNNPKGGGISRRIEGEERAELRDVMGQLNCPADYSLIARTAGIGRSTEELQWDLDYLVQLWDAISKAAVERPAPFLIYQESSLVIRAIRDYLRADVSEILIDNPEIHERAQKFMQQVMPSYLPKLKLYSDDLPLFSRYQIEQQIESAFAREVRLPSGGAVVFDHTEALLTIDVNSARATKGADIEETALNTNLEAAEEIARQLRMRDLGGLIVIDFIDMTPVRNQRMVEAKLIEALKQDRARVQVGRISRFGLLEMSRQRLRPSLGESSSLTCPRCLGTGRVRSVQSSALAILRYVQEEAMKENTAALHVHLPIETATYLLNEKRYELSATESRVGTPIVIIPTADLETPHYRLRRLRLDEVEAQPVAPSYAIPIEETAEEAPSQPNAPSQERPAIGQLLPMQSAPPPPAPAAPPSSDTPPATNSGLRSWLKRLTGLLQPDSPASSPAPAAAPMRTAPQHPVPRAPRPPSARRPHERSRHPSRNEAPPRRNNEASPHRNAETPNPHNGTRDNQGENRAEGRPENGRGRRRRGRRGRPGGPATGRPQTEGATPERRQEHEPAAPVSAGEPAVSHTPNPRPEPEHAPATFSEAANTPPPSRQPEHADSNSGLVQIETRVSQDEK